MQNSNPDSFAHGASTPSMNAASRISSYPPKMAAPVHVVAMPANAMQGDREKCLTCGMSDYVSKPMRLVELQATLERFITSSGQEPKTEN